MTNQTKLFASLGGSQAGKSMFRLSTLTLILMVAATLTAGAAIAAAQDQPAAPQKTVTPKKPVAPQEKIIGGYNVHSMIDLGGHVVAEKTGSNAMWATMVNEYTGMRVLGESLDMRTIDPSKTHFFDTLSSSSFGYGGDPYDVTRLNLSKGRIYDFAGSFRRDRNYFDYNLLANSLLGPNALVAEPDSLHIFNTVRRNTSTLFTLFPVSPVHVRLGYDHNTNEGPTYSSVHEGGDVQLMQWFRNSNGTFVGGVDWNPAKRTTLSYDQYLVLYKGDSTFHLTGATWQISGGATPVSLGVDTLATATCGSGSNKGPEVSNGVANAYCSQTIAENMAAPTRTSFPTEQLRFTSHYFEKVTVVGRYAYSGDVMNVNHFNQTFTGLLTRSFLRQEIDTGALGNGRLAHNKRDSQDGDFTVEADIGEHFAVTDAVQYRDFRVEGNNSVSQEIWAGSSTTAPPLNVNTPLSALTPTTTNTANNYFLNQKVEGNTVVGIVTVNPFLKFSGGWRFNTREIVDPGDDLTWHQNWALAGMVIQSPQLFRFTVNWESMSSKSANSTTTPSNTYTREAPDKLYHIRGRAVVKPAKWVNFSVTGNDYSAKNDDPLVNHQEHNHDVSFAAQFVPTESVSMDFSFAHDDAYSVTDLCFLTTQNPPPNGDSNAGTCVPTAANPNATSSLLLGNGFYDAPSTFFSGMINYAPSKKFHIDAGARLNNVSGTAEMLSPLQAPGALQSKIVAPFADLEFKVASQWSWHGNWNHQGYEESGAAGPAPRAFHGEIVTLGVKYAF